jgi:hypothetical protein
VSLIIRGRNRPQGLYIAGNPGFGKSSLIQHLSLQDISAGRGVAVIDPTGDLVNRLIHHIPKARANDTIYFDTDNPVPIDFFSYRNPSERQVLIDQLIDIFQLDTAPISKPRLLKILGTLFDANENPKTPEDKRCTFLDIERFITDKKRREEIIGYAARQSTWEYFPKISEFESIIERMAPFTEPGTLRTIFEAKRPKLNIWDVMQEKKVLLVNLKDSPTDLFIGSLICSKFQQATFGRRYVEEPKRTPYYLYIDECQTILKYAAPQFEAILTRARKYKLCLTLANQLPSDLPAPIQNKLGTIGTLYLFNLDSKDARIFKDRIAPYQPEFLTNLLKFHAVVRTNGAVHFLTNTPRPLGSSNASYARYIRKRTRELYTCNSPEESFTEVSSFHDDDIPPGPEPKIPSDKD